jgi:predicted RNA-binding protein
MRRSASRTRSTSCTNASNRMGVKDRQYWLATASDENCQQLAAMGHPFYALSRGSGIARSMNIGDLCVLYRARSGRGFIGVFEVTAPAKEEPVRVGFRTYPIQIPWKPLFLCDQSPVEVQELVAHLSFITNKKSYGTHFQTNLRRLGEVDFSQMSRAITERSKSANNTRA